MMTVKSKYSTLALLLFASAAMASTDKSAAEAKSAKKVDEKKQSKKEASKQKGYKNVTELKIEDLKVGTGNEAKKGQLVKVHYTGWLTNGQKFDSSLDRGQPFEFQLGQGMVIQGWDKGVAGMKVGGKRKLHIPPQMGYGDRDLGVIPPKSTLIFEVDLLDVK